MKLAVMTFDGAEALGDLAQVETGCVVVGVFEGGELSDQACALDQSKAITRAVQSGDMTGKSASSIVLREVPGVAARRVMLLGLGKREEFGEKTFEDATQALLQALARLGADEALIALPIDRIAQVDIAAAIRKLAQAAQLASYRSDSMKSEKDAPAGVARLVLAVAAGAASGQPLAEGIATGNGVELARRLGDLPPNVCTPGYLADCARSLAARYGFGLEVLDRDALRKLGMNSYLAVAQGSDLPPAFIVLRHNGGGQTDAPVVLVGKGLTFDSGGISIKPSAAMDEMKYDMGGAASVLGVFRAIGELQLPLNVVGIVAACENMPSGGATRPGDIVTTMSGLTVEVLNTDAEGRLVLCDALTYAERFAPAALIDIATLTGACVVALGHHNSGLFTRSDAAHAALADELLDAGRDAGDRAWRMPLEEAYGEQLKSRFADLANLGTPGGGAVVAAAFLERFTRKYLWAHLDIAGTAWKSGAEKGATGRPVPLLMRFLCQRAAMRQVGEDNHD